jgi:hypothetical protein
MNEIVSLGLFLGSFPFGSIKITKINIKKRFQSKKHNLQDWIYCYYCGIKLRESNMDENYVRILAMYEYELSRR